VCGLILAAGRGTRFGAAENKVLTSLLDRPILAWTIQAFAQCDAISQLILVGSDGELAQLAQLGEGYGGGKLAAVVCGGATRQESVRLGLVAIPEACDFVAVHDGARCCITPERIQHCITAASNHRVEAATLAISVTDTLAHRTINQQMGSMIDREQLVAIQTPQVFRRALLTEAHRWAIQNNHQIATDDAQLVNAYLGDASVALVEGGTTNIKVTRLEDRLIAEAILKNALQ
jgi:2-C-methyl-D-erythritol 4-phosphate cytidylyltransferase